MEGTLAPVYDCFDNIEMYYAERAMLEAKLVKEVDEMSVPEPLKSSKENVDKLLSHDNSKSDAPVVQTSVVQISSSPIHQPIEIRTSPVMQLPITTVEKKVHNTTSTSNLTTVPATSCTTPKVPLTHPRTVTTVTDSISTPVACYKLPSNPDQISTPAKQNSPWRGLTALNQVPSDLKQISTPVSQDSPWRGWTVPNQAFNKENLLKEVKNMKDNEKVKLEAVEYTIGELVVPKQYKKLVLTSEGTLKEVEFTVSGRKIPLTEIRKRELNRCEQLGVVRDHINDDYAQMSDDQISQRLRVLGDEGHLRDTPEMREKGHSDIDVPALVERPHI
ncbi:unnamed protein product [Porites evermanni]|uniref:Uncharacterized protein n=1 Tax=Porites evermanni TaxID=104178 RepID=A0ABN8PHP5_9CNID|nr:unnamed protein product [Porites evermanni]